MLLKQINHRTAAKTLRAFGRAAQAGVLRNIDASSIMIAAHSLKPEMAACPIRQASPLPIEIVRKLILQTLPLQDAAQLLLALADCVEDCRHAEAHDQRLPMDRTNQTGRELRDQNKKFNEGPVPRGYVPGYRLQPTGGKHYETGYGEYPRRPGSLLYGCSRLETPIVEDFRNPRVQRPQYQTRRNEADHRDGCNQPSTFPNSLNLAKTQTGTPTVSTKRCQIRRPGGEAQLVSGYGIEHNIEARARTLNLKQRAQRSKIIARVGAGKYAPGGEGP